MAKIIRNHIMFVLSRKQDESIVINTPEGEVEVVVVDIRGEKVRLGITAPTNIPVHRKEIWTAIQKEKTNSKS